MRKIKNVVKRKVSKRTKRTGKTETVLILRTCAADLTAHGGFKWPESGPVAAPDWSAEAECGKGLHGLLWGEGSGDLLNWVPEAKWLCVEVARKDIVDLNGKVKFPTGTVVFCGDRLGATDYMLRNGGAGHAIAGAVVAAGDYGTATAGYEGTATAGNYGTATAGDYGTATAGYKGTATAGYEGTATAGYKGTATAGDNGTIQIKWYDSGAKRYRIATGYIGENGLLPNVKYRCNTGKFVKV